MKFRMLESKEKQWVYDKTHPQKTYLPLQYTHKKFQRERSIRIKTLPSMCGHEVWEEKKVELVVEEYNPHIFYLY